MKSKLDEPSNKHGFGPIRNLIWPIHRFELIKVIPMFFLFFMVSFVYNLLKNIKTTLTATQNDVGVSAIPYLKVWLVLPAAVLFTYLFTVLANKFSRKNVFIIMLSIFIGFLGLFIFVLYPNKELIQLSSLPYIVENLTSKEFARSIAGLITVFEHWYFSMFYVMCELWSAIVLTMLFWGFANEVTTVDEAKRFYAIFALGSNASGICTGLVAKLCNLKEKLYWFPFGDTPWDQTMYILISLLLLITILIVSLFVWLNNNVFKDVDSSYSSVAEKKGKKKSERLSLVDSFKYLFRSRYLMCVVAIVLSYNLVYHLSEVMWIEQTNIMLNKDKGAFLDFQSNIQLFTGILSVVFAFLISGNLIRFYGWTVTALVTPLIWLGFGIAFYTLSYSWHNVSFREYITLFTHYNIQYLSVFFGSLLICFGKSCKYTVFDETKEITFIPLSDLEKRKSKAVVDGIVSRLGKSGGSLMLQFLIISCGGSIIDTFPYLSGICIIMLFVWIYAVMALGYQIEQHINVEPKPGDNTQAKVVTA